MKVKFTKSAVASLPPGVHWDVDQVGFGVRVSPKGKRVFITQYRTIRNESRMPKIGAFPTFTVEDARAECRRILQAVAGGKDPVEEKKARRTALTMGELFDRYVDEYLVHLEGGSVANARTAFKHMKPYIGTVSVMDMTDTKMRNCLSKINNVADLQRGKFRGRQNSCISYARSAWNWAVRNIEGFPKANIVMNPTMGIDMEQKGTRKRNVKLDEYVKVFEAIATLRGQPRIDPVKLLVCEMTIWTGARPIDCRRMEWEHVGEESVRLPYHKTARFNGDKLILLNSEAKKILERAKEFRIEGNPYVFPNLLTRKGYTGRTWDVWQNIKKLTNLDDLVHYHMRGGFISLGEKAGIIVDQMSAVVGHASVKVTEEFYQTHEQQLLLDANERVGALIRDAMKQPGPPPPDNVVPLRRAG